MKEKLKKCYMLLIFMLITFTAHYALAEVNVYCEGAYTEEELCLYIYTDITNGVELRSAGVKITYNNLILTINSAEINNNVWYIGNESCNPDTDTSGEIILIAGKLDTENPNSGVYGTRTLLGKCILNRTTSSSSFNITIGIGKSGAGGTFANFVDVNIPAQTIDSTVTFGDIKIFERGDATMDGRVTPRDINKTKSYIGTNIFHCCVDCNGDGAVTPRDINCVKSRIK